MGNPAHDFDPVALFTWLYTVGFCEHTNSTVTLWVMLLGQSCTGLIVNIICGRGEAQGQN